MCGRYNIIDDPLTRQLLLDLGVNMRLPTRHNIAPTETVPVVCQTESGRAVHPMRWWLTPSWAREVDTRFSMFNARAENLETSKAFKGPFRHRRGILPASGFIEWRLENGHKQPYWIHHPEQALALGGIWDVWERSDAFLESCAIVTLDAPPGFRPLHSRMPLILPRTAWEVWLDPDAPPEDVRQCLKPVDLSGMVAVPVDRAINNSRNKDDRAIRPVGEPLYLPLTPSS